jgi:ABC-type transport system involved in multi-copper enzyme maturation permease subunit
MKKIFSIAHYTFIQNIRNKVFYVMILFGVIIVLTSLLMGAIGGEQKNRVLLDMGMSAIEFFSLITISFASVTLILEEMETKTIYLILSRPISRLTYLLGRYFGLLIAVYSGMAIMAILHLGILLSQGWVFSWRYVLALLLSAEKIALIGSIALFFSLFSTSAISSISFTVFIWLLGHFSEEIYFLSRKTGHTMIGYVLTAVYYISPNLQFFNIKDFWDVPGIVGGWIYGAVVYGLIYCTCCIFLSLWLLQRKEF